MDISKLKKIADKEDEVFIEQNRLNKMYQSVISPMKKQLAEEFLNGFQKYFKEKDFETKDIINGTATVTYKSLSFSAQRDANDSIFIRNGNDDIAQVTIHFNDGYNGDAYSLPQDELDKKILKLDKELERLKKQLVYYQNPKFYYAISIERRNFETHESLLSFLFPYKN
jgi:hypothetical protein